MKYKALLRQTGVNDPVVTVLNPGPVAIEWNRSNTGTVLGTMDESYEGSIGCLISSNDVAQDFSLNFPVIGKRDNGVIEIDNWDVTGSIADGFYHYVEIEFFPYLKHD